MFQSIKNLLTMLRGSKKTNNDCDRFFFPETEKELEQKLLEIQKTVDQLNEKAEVLLSAKTNDFQREINRRKAYELQSEAKRLKFPHGTGEDILSKEEIIIHEMVREEWNIIARDGEIVHQLFYTFKDYRQYKEERRIVKINGTFWLIKLEWAAKGKWVNHSDYGGWSELIPNGEYEEPKVRWATRSLSQFNEAELLACKQ